MYDLSGKVAIVTGASAGIGRAAAQAFARAGARVMLADVDAPRGEAVAAAIRDAGGDARFAVTDVADDASVRALVDATTEAFGRLDCAFNNAGVEGSPMPTAESTDANWRRVVGINLDGTYYCTRAEIPAMLASGGGSIVNCSSVAGLVGFPGMAAYVASKHGVVGLTRSVALELATTGIRVNAICPGVIDTEMIERFTSGSDEVRDQLLASEPVGRMGTPEEIADSVLWLCSDGAGFVTGQAIAIDGGYVAR